MSRLAGRTLAVLGLHLALCGAVPARPLAAEQQLFPSLVGHDYLFGHAVAVDGERIVVGAIGVDDYDGAVFVFERTGPPEAPWVEVAVLSASGVPPGGQFGSAVALQGDRLLVGAQDVDQMGAAYVFEADGAGGWNQVAELLPPPKGRYFGDAVALDGDVAVVGAYGTPIGGRAYLFERDAAGSWLPAAELLASDGDFGDFGAAVAVEGDRAFAGAPEAVDGLGAVYVFERDAGGPGAWSEVAKLTAGDGGGELGAALAAEGRVLVAGAPEKWVTGGIHVFEQRDGEWLEVAAHEDLADVAEAGVGWSVAIDDDVIVAGLPQIYFDFGPDRGPGTADEGGARVFHRHAGGTDEWGLLAAYEALTAEPADQVGVSVALSGRTLVVGADGDDALGWSDLGSVHVARPNDLRLTVTGDCPGEVRLTLVGAEPEAPVAFLTGSDEGYSQVPSEPCSGTYVDLDEPSFLAVVPAGPDGGLTVDLPVGPEACRGPVQALDLATCWAGTVTRLPAAPMPVGVSKLVPEAVGYWDLLRSVAMSGDTALLGARYDEGPGARGGAVYVFEPASGEAATWTELQRLTAPDGEPHDELGFAVAVDGEIALLSAWGDDDLGSNAGAAYVFEPDGQGRWEMSAKLTASDGGADDRFGGDVAVSGQTLVVGAYWHAHEAIEGSGAAYVFEPDPDQPGSWLETAELRPDAVSRWVGRSVAIDGDRLASASNAAAAVWIWERTGQAPSPWELVATLHDDRESTLGTSVALDGDLLVAGASTSDRFGTYAGAAYLFERGEDGVWRFLATLRPEDHGYEDRFGSGVAVRGDLVAVSSNQGGNENDAGSVHLFRRPPEGGEWVETGRLVAPDGDAGDYFGGSLALGPGRALVAAGSDDDVATLAGSAYLFELP